MPEPEEIALVRLTMEVLDRGGPEELLARYEELCAEDFEWRPALLASVEGERTFVGKEEFASYWRDFTGTFGEPDLGEQTYEAIGEGRVLVTGRLKVAGVGSGVPIDQEAAYLFTVQEGRIVFARSFMSRHEAEEFLAHA